MQRKNNDIQYKKVLKQYHLSDKTLKMAKTIRDYVFLRTYMTEHTDYLFFNGRIRILDEICTRAKITDSQLVMLSLKEILDMADNNFIFDSKYESLIKERTKGFAMTWLNGTISTYFGKDALELQSKVGKVLIPSESANSTNVITGSIANKGKVIGIAKVLQNYSDINKVNSGDIIVASMTTPDYISAMEKAVGFVTDEGGITCHAAIISREFDIPCVVGTLNATKLIRSGQKIELDAYSGTITILD